MPPMMAAFVREYLVDTNGTAAAIRAGATKRSADSQAAKWMMDPRVKREIQLAMDRRAQRLEVKQDDVLREIMRIAFVDISEAYDDNGHFLPLKQMPVDVRRALAGVEVEQLWEGSGADRIAVGTLVKAKFWPKDKSLEMLMRHLGAFLDRVKHEGLEGLAAELAAARRRADSSA